MEIRIKPPNPAEATWKIDPKTNEIIITPYFYGNMTSQVVGYIEAVGDGGSTLRGTVRASGKSGRVANVYPKGSPVPCDFDKVSD
jgi:hypothetical protein